MGAILLVVLSLFIGSCVPCTANQDPPVHAFYADRLVPEGWYENIYNRLVDCTGIDSTSYSDIEWYSVRNSHPMGIGNRRLSGVWSSPNRIYLAESHVMHAPTIAHELLHYLTRAGNADPEFVRFRKTCIGEAS